MARSTRDMRERIDADGVRIREGRAVRAPVWIALAAIVVVAGALLFGMRRHDEERGANLAARGEPGAAPQHHLAGAPPAPALPPRRADAVVPPRPLVPAPPVPAERAAPNAAAEVVAGQQEAPMFGPSNPGERSGVALFPPPGTKPIKRGILVPEDFELPPGYIRHYQATDDGQRVPAILMFHPDYHPLDEHGEPIALPADRVVPPEMAPPGMPIEMLQPPPERTGEDSPP